MRELLNGADVSLFHHFPILLLQFSHRRRTGTGGTLVAGDVHFTDVAEPVNGVKNHNHHNSCTIRIGYYAAWMDESVLRINLGDNQRNIIFHAELAGIVNHYRAILRNGIGKFGRRSATGRGKCNVNVSEIIVMLKLFYGIFLSLKGIFAPRATL